MHGIYLGRIALLLLVPAVTAFGLFMFGAGFLSGQFYSDRTAPTETIVRREPAQPSRTASILNRKPHVPEHKAAEESMAQATGILEQKNGTAPAEEQTVAQTQPEEVTPAPAPEPESEITEQDAQQIREAALADLRAQTHQGQENQSPPQREQPAFPSQNSVGFSFQVGAFLVQTNAQELAANLQTQGYDSWVADERDKEGRLWHFVRVGHYATREDAATAALAFNQRQGVEAVIVAIGGNQGATTAGAVPHGAQQTSGAPSQPQAATPEETFAKPIFVVQAGAFRNPQNARNAAAPLLEKGYVPCIATVQDQEFQTWNVVEVATFSSRAEAEAFLLEHGTKAGVDLAVRQLDAARISDRQCF